MDLNSMFPKGKVYKTETLAHRALNKFESALIESDVADYHSVILPTERGYQVIIILRHGNKMPIRWFIDAGFCVTN